MQNSGLGAGAAMKYFSGHQALVHIGENNKPIEATHQEKYLMAFVNEYASKEDISKYHLDEICKKYLTNPEMTWTVDRESDIFMVPGARLRTEGVVDARRYLISRQGKLTEHTLIRHIDMETRTINWRYGRVGKPRPFRSEGERLEWEATLADLKDAMRAYKAWGVFKTPTNEFENVVFVDF